MSDDATDRAMRPVQAAALSRIARRLHRAGSPPWLHAEVARRMGERLALIRVVPDEVIDWWGGDDAGTDVLHKAYPRARLLRVVDPGWAPHRVAAAPWWSPRRWAGSAPETIEPGAVRAGSAGLVWANMMLHGVADPAAELRQWHRALAVDGFVMFSTLGPGSLQGLRELYAQHGWPSPHAAFVDMHDIGDMLVRAGFADPVMDQELITLTWPDAGALLAELRTLGGNADPRRYAGLRTPRWRQQLLEALQGLRDEQGRVRLVFEVVYGHAFKAAPKPRVTTQTEVALDDMRTMVRSSRRDTPPR